MHLVSRWIWTLVTTVHFFCHFAFIQQCRRKKEEERREQRDSNSKGKNRGGGEWKMIMLVVESWVGLSLPARWLSAPGGKTFLPRSPAPGAAGTEQPWARLPPADAMWPPSAAYRSPVDEVSPKSRAKSKGRLGDKKKKKNFFHSGSRIQDCDLTRMM